MNIIILLKSGAFILDLDFWISVGFQDFSGFIDYITYELLWSIYGGFQFDFWIYDFSNFLAVSPWNCGEFRCTCHRTLSLDSIHASFTAIKSLRRMHVPCSVTRVARCGLPSPRPPWMCCTSTLDPEASAEAEFRWTLYSVGVAQNHSCTAACTLHGRDDQMTPSHLLRVATQP